MTMTCKICRHEKRAEIERELVEGKSGLRAIAGRFNVSRSSLMRHKDHIPAHLVKAKEAKDTAQAGDLLTQVVELQSRTLDILSQAEKAGDLRTALYGVSQARGNTELQCKMLAYLREQQLDELSQRRKADIQEVSPLSQDPVFMTALQRAIDETEAYYEQTGQLPGPGTGSEILIN